MSVPSVPSPPPGAPLRPGTVLQGGRAKAYRPRTSDERRAALLEAIAAYERGDFFLAHELLEPAWMGTADEPERELYQGLIKLAAAFVHEVRGNPAGVEKNLRGARLRLSSVIASGGPTGGIDLPALVGEIDRLLVRLGLRDGLERLDTGNGDPIVPPALMRSPR